MEARLVLQKGRQRVTLLEIGAGTIVTGIWREVKDITFNLEQQKPPRQTHRSGG
jgi:hypothetical protein